MRPVFLRIEPTFDSSFFGSGAGLVGVTDADFTGWFLPGLVSGCLAGAGFGSLGAGACTSCDGCGSGVEFTTGAAGSGAVAAAAGGV